MTPRRGVASRRNTAVRVRAARNDYGKDGTLRELVQALVTAGATKVEKDWNELVVEPFSDPDPKPLAGLLPPSDLADEDSKFVAVTVRGESVTLHYKEALPPPRGGARDGDRESRGVDALVCLHGANGSEFSFRHLLPRVAEETGLRCVAFDRPPYGLSSRPSTPVQSEGGDAGDAKVNVVYTPEGQAELTLALMDALGIRRAAILGHSAGAPVALDAALLRPERCPRLIMVAPAVFIGGAGTGGAPRLPLDRALRFAWFRFLISQDAPGLNVVRGSVNRQIAAIEEGRMYADLAPEVREAYMRPTKAEGWDQGLLQLFRSGSFGGDGERLRAAMHRLVGAGGEGEDGGSGTGGTKVAIIIGLRDKTTPPALAQGLRDALLEAGVEVQYEAMPAAAHLPMEEVAGGVREAFEALVVDVVAEAAAAAQ